MDMELVELEARPVAVVRGDVAMGDLPGFFDRAFHEVMAELERQGIAAGGPPFGHYLAMPTDVVSLEAGFPTMRPIDPAGDVQPSELPGGVVARTVHVGPYDTMEQTYEALRTWMVEHHVEPAEHMWETYLSDPATAPDPSTWRTEIFWPVDDAAPAGSATPGAVPA